MISTKRAVRCCDLMRRQLKQACGEIPDKAIANQIWPKGFGNTRPLPGFDDGGGDPRSGYEENRRVEFHIVSHEEGLQRATSSSLNRSSSGTKVDGDAPRRAALPLSRQTAAPGARTRLQSSSKHHLDSGAGVMPPTPTPPLPLRPASSFGEARETAPRSVDDRASNVGARGLLARLRRPHLSNSDSIERIGIPKAADNSPVDNRPAVLSPRRAAWDSPNAGSQDMDTMHRHRPPPSTPSSMTVDNVQMLDGG